MLVQKYRKLDKTQDSLILDIMSDTPYKIERTLSSMTLTSKKSPDNILSPIDDDVSSRMNECKTITEAHKISRIRVLGDTPNNIFSPRSEHKRITSIPEELKYEHPQNQNIQSDIDKSQIYYDDLTNKYVGIDEQDDGEFLMVNSFSSSQSILP